MSVSRRHLLGLTPLAFLPLGWLKPVAIVSAAAPPAPGPAFPLHPPEIVREAVITSHGNVVRIKELVSRTPALARAAIEWGYGDWEDCLGAASHVGNREIAEFLLANGARPSIFSAAMLGQLEVVKAFITATPGIEATHGPHSITLLRHAMNGGLNAQPVVDYLKTLPGADRKPATQPISVEELSALAGTYVFGPNADERMLVTLAKESLSIARPGGSPRGLTHLGDRTFYPAGATAARIKFAESGSARTLSVFDPDLLVTAEKQR